MQKRLDRLTRAIRPSSLAPLSDTELAERLNTELDGFLQRGDIDASGELNPACPSERRGLALLCALFLDGSLK